MTEIDDKNLAVSDSENKIDNLEETVNESFDENDEPTEITQM